MTQPVEVPQAPEPTTPAPPPVPMTLEEEIMSRANVDADELVDLPGRIPFIDWKDWPPWRVGKNVPGNDNYTVYAIFGTPDRQEQERIPFIGYAAGDLRVYALPKQSLPGDSHRRYTINRGTMGTLPGTIAEDFSREAFIQEIARELLELVDLNGLDVGEDCPTCEESNRPENTFCSFCGTKLPEDEEEEEEEEEGEETE